MSFWSKACSAIQRLNSPLLYQKISMLGSSTHISQAPSFGSLIHAHMYHAVVYLNLESLLLMIDLMTRDCVLGDKYVECCVTAVCLVCRLQQCWNLGCCFPRAGSCGLALSAVPALPSSSCWGSAGMVCISLQPCRKQKHAHPAGLCRYGCLFHPSCL